MPAKSPSKSAVRTPAKAPAKTAARTGVKASAKAFGSESAKPAVKAPAKVAAKPAAAEKQSAAASKSAGAAGNGSVKAAPKTAAKAVDAAREKARKPKLVRDSFTMPEAEYQVLVDLKKTCIKSGFEVKKSELLRVGVALLQQADMAKLKQILASLPALKAGRPKKAK